MLKKKISIMKRCNNCGWFNLDSVTHCEKCDEESFEMVVETPQENSTPAEEKVAEVAVSEPEQPEQCCEEVKEPEPAPEVKPKNNFANATVAFGSAAAPKVEVVSKPQNPKAMKATVMDASSVLESMASSEPEKPAVAEAPAVPEAPVATSSCHKCRYPISGNVEYCPNCGATIRNNNPRATVRTQPLQGDISATVSEQSAGFDPMKTVALGAEAPAKPQAPAASSSSNLKATVRDVPEELIVDNKECYKLVPVDAIGDPIIELTLDTEVVIAGRRYKFQK